MGSNRAWHLLTRRRDGRPLRSRVRQQEVVAELGQRALESDDLDGLLTEAVAAVRDTLEVDRCGVLESLPGEDAVAPREGIGWADVLTDLEVRIEESDAEITLDDLPRVYGDRGQLRQVFQNLVDDAISYAGEESPRISVFAEKGRQEWVISVRNRGIGIDPDDTDRIFRVFVRLHSIEEYHGTGIGLALCRRIVERHDGEIAVESTPGEGSTFPVTLPAPPDPTTATGPTTDDSND